MNLNVFLLKSGRKIGSVFSSFLSRKEWQILNSYPNVKVPKTLVYNKSFRFSHGKLESVKIDIADNVTCRNNCFFHIANHAELIIENNVFFNNNCSVNCLDKVFIGENTMFGEGVRIYDHNHSYADENGELKIELNKFSKDPVIIGKNSWIGSNTIILKGVTVGNNVIIGANVVVHKSVPDNTILVNKQNLETINRS
ncbi:MAG: acyltransferase [Chryseobacterium sp.]|nr:MAG: acyltransferase [Chryseobacterium sp.]